MSPQEFLLILAGIGAGTAFLLSPVTIVKTILRHREKMTELKHGTEGSPALLEEIQRLRQEVAELRETTTRFDMSFDAALAQVKDRLTTVEQEQGQTRYSTNTPVERVEVSGRRG